MDKIISQIREIVILKSEEPRWIQSYIKENRRTGAKDSEIRDNLLNHAAEIVICIKVLDKEHQQDAG